MKLSNSSTGLQQHCWSSKPRTPINVHNGLNRKSCLKSIRKSPSALRNLTHCTRCPRSSACSSISPGRCITCNSGHCSIAPSFQEAMSRLQQYWSRHGCVVWLPHNTEVGAGTMNPATFLRVLGPEPWNVAYVEPSIRPDDSRYGDNPNRLQRHTQFQVHAAAQTGCACACCALHRTSSLWACTQ